jgi:asparagine synthase (glutamine-hydrolysing)
MYLLCKYIREKTSFKVVFTGECSDELFSGYLFNYEVPVDKIQYSTRQMVKNIHQYDVLRADSCISQNGLESRVPFSDQNVIESAWHLPDEMKHPMY